MAALLVAHHDSVTELGKVKNYDFVYLCVDSAGSLLLCGFSPAIASKGYSLVGVRASWWCLLLSLSTGSRLTDFSSYSSQALEHRFHSCGAWA